MKQWNWFLIPGIWAAKFFAGAMAGWILNTFFVLFLQGQSGATLTTLGYGSSPQRLVPLLFISAVINLVAGYWIAMRAPARPLGHALWLTGFSIFVGRLVVNTGALYGYPVYFNLGRYFVIAFIIPGGWAGAKARETEAAKPPKHDGAAGKPPIASPFGD